MSLSRTFAGRGRTLAFESLPADIVSRVRTCLADYLSAAVGGHDFAWSQQAVTLAAAEAGASTVPGTAVRTSLSQAVFTGAVLGGSTSQMDTHPESASHPGSAIWPALLPLAEAHDVDGGELIAAALAGYEVNGRLGRAIFGGVKQFRFRPTGVLGAPAAAAACARLLRLDDDAAAAAIGIAANTACGLMEWAKVGTTEHIFHAAFAARNALTAVQLARAGTRSAPTALEGPDGLVATFGAPDRAALAVPGADDTFEIEKIQHKPAPACIFVQTPCQAALELASHPAFVPERVRSIRIRVCAPAIAYPGCDYAGVLPDIQAARMSVQFSIAAVLVHRRITVENWRDFRNPVAAALAAKSVLIDDPAFSRAFPAQQGAAIEITLDDGTVLAVKRDDLMSLGPTDIAGRLHSVAALRLGENRAAPLIDLVARMGSGVPVRALLEAVRLR